MSVFIDSKQALLGYLNKANNTTMFTLDNLVWSAPAPIAGTWMEGTTTKNTFMKVSAAQGAGFEGKTVVKYDRLKLSNFANFKPTRNLKAYQPKTAHDLLPNILYYFGIVLGTQDIVDEPLTLVDGAGTVTLKAKVTSPLWLDQLTFDISPGGASLDQAMTVKSLNGLNYPVQDPTTQTSALLYVYPLNFTAYRDELLAMTEGTLTQTQADRLVVMLKALDKGPGATLWNADSANVLWSLAGAKVVFNGLNSLGLVTNQSYKYVMAIDLREGVTTPTGRFYLHFNDPDDPNSAN